MIGRTIDGRYELEAELGRGATGIVYRAKQRSVHDRVVALKLIEPMLLGNPTSVKRFENESKAIASLRHPSTIKLYDVGRDEDGRLFIVMELVEGASLQDALADGPLSLERTLRILTAIVGALGEAHSKGIVHRDLKASNVMLETFEDQELVKVLDFGLAKMADTKLTAPTQICGTPGYMAPEQSLGAPVDAKADLFSVGALAYLLLTGAPPFSGEDADEIMADTLQRDPPPLHTVAQVPHALSQLVQSLLAKHPDDRPENAETVRAQLAKIAATPARAESDPSEIVDATKITATQQIPAQSPPRAPQTKSPRRRGQTLGRGPWLALFFVAALAGFSIVVSGLSLWTP